MDFNILDKSSSVTPVLVRLYDSHKLYNLARDKQPQARAELTAAVSNLLEMQLSVRESELVADILIALMRQAEKDLRQALAERLSVSEGAPLRLVLQIVNDEIDIAAPVLRNSPVLGDMDLMYIIKSKSAEYWRAIAARKNMSDYVMNALADTEDFETALTLAENMNIRLTEHALDVLAGIAQKNTEIATPLLRRDEVTDDLAGQLYRFVGQEIRNYILEHYNVKTDILIEAIDDIVLEFADVAEREEFMPTQAIVKSAERFGDKGLLTVQLMLGTLKRGQVQSFIAQFARYTGLPSETILSIIRQPSGQGLAVACKAFGILKTDFVSIFLLTNRVRNEGKMIEVKDINRAIGYFDRIGQDVAAGIIGNSIEEALEAGA